MRWKQLNPLSLRKLVGDSAAAAAGVIEAEMVVDDPNGAGRRRRGRPRKNVPVNTGCAERPGKAATLDAGTAGRPRKSAATALDTGSAGRHGKAAALDTASTGRPRKAVALDPVGASGGTPRRYDFRKRGAEKPQCTEPHTDNSDSEQGSLDSEGDSEYTEEDQPQQDSLSDHSDEESSGRGEAGKRSNRTRKQIGSQGTTKRVTPKTNKVGDFETPEWKQDSGGSKRKADEANQQTDNDKQGQETDGGVSAEVIKRRAIECDGGDDSVLSNQRRPDRFQATGDINSQGSIRDRMIRRQLLLMEPIVQPSTIGEKSNGIPRCRSTDAVCVSNVGCGSSVNIRDIAATFERKANEKSVGDLWASINSASLSYTQQPQQSIESISRSNGICTSKAATIPASRIQLESKREEFDPEVLVSERGNGEEESCFSPFVQSGNSNLSRSHARALRKSPSKILMGTTKQALQNDRSFHDSENLNGEESSADVHTRKDHINSIHSMYHSRDAYKRISKSIKDKTIRNQECRLQSLQAIQSIHNSEDVNAEESHDAVHTVIDHMTNIPSTRHCGDVAGTILDTILDRRKQACQSRKQTMQKRNLCHDFEDVNDEESSPGFFSMAMNTTYHCGDVPVRVSDSVVDRIKQIPQSRKHTLQRNYLCHDFEDVNGEELSHEVFPMADRMNNFRTTRKNGIEERTLSNTLLANAKLKSHSRKALQNKEDSCAAVFGMTDRTENIHRAHHSGDASEIISNTMIGNRRQNYRSRKEAIQNIRYFHGYEDMNGEEPHTAVSTNHMINICSTHHPETMSNTVSDKMKHNPQSRKETIQSIHLFQDSEDVNARESYAALVKDVHTDTVYCANHSGDVSEILLNEMVDKRRQNSRSRNCAIQGRHSFHGSENMNGEEPHAAVSSRTENMINICSTHNPGIISRTLTDNQKQNPQSRKEALQSIHTFHASEDMNGEESCIAVPAVTNHMINISSPHLSGTVLNTMADQNKQNPLSRKEALQSTNLFQDSEDVNAGESHAALFTTIDHLDNIRSVRHSVDVRETISNTITDKIQNPSSRNEDLRSNHSFQNPSFYDSENIDIQESPTDVFSMMKHKDNYLSARHSEDTRKSMSYTSGDKKKCHSQNNHSCHDSEDMDGEKTPDSVRTTDQHTDNIDLPSSGATPHSNVGNARGSSKRRGRGISRGAKFWSETRDRKVPITLNADGNPIGPHRKDLVLFLGIVARNSRFLPMNCVDWRRIPLEKKNEIWKFVQSKFIIGLRARKAVFELMGRSWASFRAEIRNRYYKPCNNYHDCLANCPPRVDHCHWKFLVDYWESEKGKLLSDSNKRSRKFKKTNHTSGQKAFSCIEAELQENSGRKASRWELFLATHLRKDGSPADETSAEIIEKVKAAIAIDGGYTDADEIFNQILGPRKRAHHARDSAYKYDNTYVEDLESVLAAQKQEIEVLRKTQQFELLDLRERQKRMEVAICSLQSPSIPRSMPDLRKDFKTAAFQKKHSVRMATISQPNFVEGQEVNLLSFDDTKILVAQGEVVSIDSTVSIGGTALGSRFLALFIDVVIEPDEPLVRPYAKYEKMEDSLGAVIAWPMKLIASR